MNKSKTISQKQQTTNKNDKISIEKLMNISTKLNQKPKNKTAKNYMKLNLNESLNYCNKLKNLKQEFLSPKKRSVSINNNNISQNISGNVQGNEIIEPLDSQISIVNNADESSNIVYGSSHVARALKNQNNNKSFYNQSTINISETNLTCENSHIDTNIEFNYKNSNFDDIYEKTEPIEMENIIDENNQISQPILINNQKSKNSIKRTANKQNIINSQMIKTQDTLFREFSEDEYYNENLTYSNIKELSNIAKKVRQNKIQLNRQKYDKINKKYEFNSVPIRNNKLNENLSLSDKSFSPDNFSKLILRNEKLISRNKKENKNLKNLQDGDLHQVDRKFKKSKARLFDFIKNESNKNQKSFDIKKRSNAEIFSPNFEDSQLKLKLDTKIKDIHEIIYNKSPKRIKSNSPKFNRSNNSKINKLKTKESSITIDDNMKSNKSINHRLSSPDQNVKLNNSSQLRVSVSKLKIDTYNSQEDNELNMSFSPKINKSKPIIPKDNFNTLQFFIQQQLNDQSVIKDNKELFESKETTKMLFDEFILQFSNLLELQNSLKLIVDKENIVESEMIENVLSTHDKIKNSRNQKEEKEKVKKQKDNSNLIKSNSTLLSLNNKINKNLGLIESLKRTIDFESDIKDDLNDRVESDTTEKENINLINEKNQVYNNPIILRKDKIIELASKLKSQL